MHVPLGSSGHAGDSRWQSTVTGLLKIPLLLTSMQEVGVAWVLSLLHPEPPVVGHLHIIPVVNLQRTSKLMLAWGLCMCLHVSQ